MDENWNAKKNDAATFFDMHSVRETFDGDSDFGLRWLDSDRIFVRRAPGHNVEYDRLERKHLYGTAYPVRDAISQLALAIRLFARKFRQLANAQRFAPAMGGTTRFTTRSQKKSRRA